MKDREQSYQPDNFGNCIGYIVTLTVFAVALALIVKGALQ